MKNNYKTLEDNDSQLSFAIFPTIKNYVIQQFMKRNTWRHKKLEPVQRPLSLSSKEYNTLSIYKKSVIPEHQKLEQEYYTNQHNRINHIKRGIYNDYKLL